MYSPGIGNNGHQILSAYLFKGFQTSSLKKQQEMPSTPNSIECQIQEYK